RGYTMTSKSVFIASFLCVAGAVLGVPPASQPDTGNWRSASTNDLKAAAERADVRAMIEMGLRSETGRGGVKKDVDEGLKWIRRAADTGDADAQTLAGL